MTLATALHVAPIGPDLVALAQVHALDASVFPFPSIPYVLSGARSLWVARHDGAVLGFVAVGRRGVVLEIESLAVLPAARRTGVARALLRAVLDDARARGFREAALHVSTANGSALRLYRAEGFREKRLLPAFYAGPRFGDGGNAWRMIRPL